MLNHNFACGDAVLIILILSNTSSWNFGSFNGFKSFAQWYNFSYGFPYESPIADLTLLSSYPIALNIYIINTSTNANALSFNPEIKSSLVSRTHTNYGPVITPYSNN